ncbi:hypothetical protein CS022_22445 [Veronia nyctiphanis]|uniref:Lipoprotein n=1 Tax=Veronia nyctiphanis TaxID=1278244 RepID=A0A4Q0YJA0_9GAMM|nr:hypothetical protein [Veronia nyctiphanis]RXJ70787.1 hypothetical protein CS022_22445 [Veronia nyctiphanis]
MRHLSLLFFLISVAFLSGCSSESSKQHEQKFSIPKLGSVSVELDVKSEKRLEAVIVNLLAFENGVYTTHDFDGYNELIELTSTLSTTKTKEYGDWSIFIEDESGKEIINILGDYKGKFFFDYIESSASYTWKRDDISRTSAYYTGWHIFKDKMVVFDRTMPLQVYQYPSFELIKEHKLPGVNKPTNYKHVVAGNYFHLSVDRRNVYKVIDLDTGSVVRDGPILGLKSGIKSIGLIKKDDEVFVFFKEGLFAQLDERGNLKRLGKVDIDVESLAHVGQCLAIGSTDGHLAFIPDDLSSLLITSKIHDGWVSHVTADENGNGYSTGIDKRVVSWSVPEACL